MTEYKTSIEIKAPPERVWEVMRDVQRWHEWTQSITSIKPFGKGSFEVGYRFIIRQPKLPMAMWKITELNEGKAFSWVSGIPLIFRTTAIHSVEGSRRGALVKLTVRYNGLLGSMLAQMTKEITERYLSLEANGLKERSESAVPH